MPGGHPRTMKMALWSGIGLRLGCQFGQSEWIKWLPIAERPNDLTY